jgi:hypothetical protein
VKKDLASSALKPSIFEMIQKNISHRAAVGIALANLMVSVVSSFLG